MTTGMSTAARKSSGVINYVISGPPPRRRPRPCCSAPSSSSSRRPPSPPPLRLQGAVQPHRPHQPRLGGGGGGGSGGVVVVVGNGASQPWIPPPAGAATGRTSARGSRSGEASSNSFKITYLHARPSHLSNKTLILMLNKNCCSLSNYSSGGGESSRHSSLDDSGVFNDDGIGSEGHKLRVQMPPSEGGGGGGGDGINYQQGGRKPSRINIPFVVSIGKGIVCRLLISSSTL